MKPLDSNASGKSHTIRISAEDLEILNRFRGDLPAAEFISLILRMMDSGRVVSKPPWVNKTNQE